jgi:hypothetical protein
MAFVEPEVCDCVVSGYILVYIVIENQQMHQNDHFIVMSSPTLLYVLAYYLHHQGACMILTSYLYVSVHYRNCCGTRSTTVHCFQQQLVITTGIHSVTILIGANLLETPLLFL